MLCNFSDKPKAKNTHESSKIILPALSPSFIYLNGRWRALFAGSRRGECGRGLDKCGGHLWRHWSGGACPTPAIRHIANQPHAAVHLDVDVAFGSHVKDFETIVIKTGELALVGPLPVVSANGDCCLGVEDCQLSAWHRRRECWNIKGENEGNCCHKSCKDRIKRYQMPEFV